MSLGRRLSSTEPGCALGSCAGAQPIRKSLGRIPVPTWSPTVKGARRWPSRSTRRRIRSGRGWYRLGGDRGGWYSWDHLDNAGRPSAHRVHPEWQDLALGDYVKYWTRRHGPVDAWQVAALEPNRFLGLRGLSDLRGRRLDPKQPRPSAYTEGLWGFLLNELPGGRTRLVIGGYQAFRPRWLGRFLDYWLYPPVVWIMQARMLAVLKRNAERAAPPRTQVADSGTTG